MSLERKTQKFEVSKALRQEQFQDIMRKEFKLTDEEIEVVIMATAKKYRQLIARPNPTSPSYINTKPEFFHVPGEIPKSGSSKDLN
jgi:hypothetical protein